MREDVVEDGRFGGTEAAAPSVVLLVLSVLGSAFGVRDVFVPMVDVRGGRLFSSPSSLLFPAGFRDDEGTGRVGGLLIVLPVVREDNAAVLLPVGDAGVLVPVLNLDEAVVGFFESSSAGFAGGFPPGVVRRSMFSHYTSAHQSRAVALRL